MAPVLYVVPYSQPVRATLMTIAALDLKVDLKEVNLIDKQQLEQEFLEINPQHTVPTLVEEDGFILWDSHAINSYLVDKYAKDDSLYPKDLKQRAIVNQRLHFDSGILFPLNVLGPIIYGGEKTIPEDKISRVEEAYTLLEKFLTGQNFVAGNSVTIADFSIVATVTTLDVVVPIRVQKYPNVVSWIKRMEGLPWYHWNLKGLTQIRNIVEVKLK